MNPRFPTLSAVVLAAGLSRRFGARNKLLEPVEGVPLAVRAIRPFTRLGLKEVVVVLGHEAPLVAERLQELPVRLVTNPDYLQGMGSSLARGVASLDQTSIDGCLVSLADLPYLRTEDVASVATAFLAEGASRIVGPAVGGQRGHPVCFPRRRFAELASLEGDQGAKAIIKADAECLWIEVDSAGCVRDMDTEL